ncbi:hypothetical protein ASPCADRAFT_205254 [Aspergillus carbonarius ITEM 5010]|uniref:Uncharacterized protein n=1 Tax=Aspergillus carbonarius (strain ITEM 5010) TaxID=602072 RepID=A0A1R3RU04_ASPC5|nr:hypothetical protein ASPCADRAFT_205254 [Aspergillus carbonarius ITEM 5010]
MGKTTCTIAPSCQVTIGSNAYDSLPSHLLARQSADRSRVRTKSKRWKPIETSRRSSL